MYGINNVFKYSVPSYNFYRETFPVDDGLGIKFYNMSSYPGNTLRPLYTEACPSSYTEFALLRYLDVGEYSKTLNILSQYRLSSLICPYITSLLASYCYMLESIELYSMSSLPLKAFENCSRLHDVTLLYSSVVSMTRGYYDNFDTPLFDSEFRYYSGSCHLYVLDSLYDAYLSAYPKNGVRTVGYFLHDHITKLSERPY